MRRRSCDNRNSCHLAQQCKQFNYEGGQASRACFIDTYKLPQRPEQVSACRT
jgi:hypothetical protein